jgi:hypothetical protein
MTIEQYFQREDTPGAGSPTGLAVVALLKLRPELEFEDARRLVNEIGASLNAPAEVAKRAEKLLTAEMQVRAA